MQYIDVMRPFYTHLRVPPTPLRDVERVESPFLGQVTHIHIHVRYRDIVCLWASAAVVQTSKKAKTLGSSEFFSAVTAATAAAAEEEECK